VEAAPRYHRPSRRRLLLLGFRLRCPAWGYDTGHESYDYDGPIYTYGNLLPDQVIINVQHALKERGYYIGDVTGSLGPASRQALNAYQRDYGLEVTGAIDEPTVRALGLI